MRKVILIILGLSLFGCGGDSSENTEPKNPTPVETPSYEKDVIFGESSWGEGTW